MAGGCHRGSERLGLANRSDGIGVAIHEQHRNRDRDGNVDRELVGLQRRAEERAAREESARRDHRFRVAARGTQQRHTRAVRMADEHETGWIDTGHVMSRVDERIDIEDCGRVHTLPSRPVDARDRVDRSIGGRVVVPAADDRDEPRRGIPLGKVLVDLSEAVRAVQQQHRDL